MNSLTGNNSGNSANNQNEDYVDKGLDSIEKKQGIDSQKARGVNEKITDGARDMFEKSTGKNVPDKISN
ncbi:hypothetical protein P280DRAFT_524420 [Massarina eburnea CBS 473.64]|uniref:Uncharacterized protein n=1 Tax=Massarina eburnea CBS 473.64 TaxID=1395130 RepID=A0A6A6RG51_9PLEO|nr:hypothetical protein P280DRAFT_524420 [Massarina eburnea CBS 473.64]